MTFTARAPFAAPHGKNRLRRLVVLWLWCLLLLVCLQLPTRCNSLSLKSSSSSTKQNPSFLPNLLSKFQADKPVMDDDPKLRSELYLQSLNISVASTVPRAFYCTPNQIPNLLRVSIPNILLRGGSGIFAQDYTISVTQRSRKQYTIWSFRDWQIEESGSASIPQQQAEPLILYEYEHNGDCRKVREVCSMLSLTVTILPSPPSGRVFRPTLKSKFGSKAKPPFLVDPNSSVTIGGADDIIKYLCKVYGNGNIPWTVQPNNFIVLTTLNLGCALSRIGAIADKQDSNPPTIPLKLWTYEGSPFGQLVRETLSYLELPHTIIYTPRGSFNRQRLFERKEKFFQVPYLEDPSTNVQLYESQAIIEYLTKQYGVSKSPVRYL